MYKTIVHHLSWMASFDRTWISDFDDDRFDLTGRGDGRSDASRRDDSESADFGKGPVALTKKYPSWADIVLGRDPA